MQQYKKFIWNTAAAFLVIMGMVFGFVTWMDPFRNLGFAWTTPFISDRNIAYKRFKLLENTSQVTDLIVGSSTSEVFVPQVLKDRFGVQAFTVSTGGAGVALRYLLVKQAIDTQPQLKRIIYVADLFEFENSELNTSAYYQSEMIKKLDPDLMSTTKPGLIARLNDYFSYFVIDRSIRTLKDIIAQKKGKYVSAYHPDGSTTMSMIGAWPRSEGIAKNALRSALGMEPLYGKMQILHPESRKVFEKMVKVVEAKEGLELHLVITPFHEAFFKYYETRFEKNRVYSEWVKELRSLQSLSRRGHIHAFSYPESLRAGVGSEDRFWNDGVHFSSETMLIMANRIYSHVQGTAKSPGQ